MKTRTLLIWIGLGIWLLISLAAGRVLAYDMTFRINNLEVIPGSGSIQRDPEGVIYHVRASGEARKIYPQLAPPSYSDDCIDCRVVREAGLSGTTDYCAVGSRATLPELDFQVPCRTGVTLDSGPRVVGLGIFVTPIVLFLILMGIRKGVFKPKTPDLSAGGGAPQRDKFKR